MARASKQDDLRRFGDEGGEQESRAQAEAPFPDMQDSLHSSHTPGGARRGPTFGGESRERGGMARRRALWKGFGTVAAAATAERETYVRHANNGRF